jgi:phosphatidylserine/phosphatidylglycerophosphate/cardiolipin synthase-like enzyme
MAWIQGPLVGDVEANFVQRWNAAKVAGVSFSAHATVLPKPAVPQSQLDVKGQIARTMPAKYPAVPAGEKGILDLYVKAIRSAKQYIYIEDQYFRSQTIAREVAQACTKNRKLIIIAVTQPDYASDLEADELWKVASLTTKWSAAAYNTIKSAVKDFCLFFLQVADVDKKGRMVFRPVNLHAKIMVVDDIWYTIGSCNLNDRGFEFEGELNVAVLHDSAKALRQRLFAEHLESPCPDSIAAAAKLWYEHAKENHQAWAAKTKPWSRVFPFGQAGPLRPIFPPDWM